MKKLIQETAEQAASGLRSPESVPSAKKRTNRDKSMTTNQMIALFREVLEPHQ